MSNLPRRTGRHGSSKARRQAAEQALDENLFPASTRPGSSSPVEPISELELASMRSLIQTLEELPEEAWNRRLGTAPARGAAGNAVRPRSRTMRRWFTPVAPGVFAAVASAFVIGALLHPFSGTSSPNVSVSRSAAHVILEPLTGAPDTSRAVAYMPGGDHMLVRVHNLPRSAPGTYYELWLMTSTTDLVSVTSFRIRATGTDTLQLLLPDDPRHYKYLDISVQHIGDAGAISGDNVLRGTIHT